MTSRAWNIRMRYSSVQYTARYPADVLLLYVYECLEHGRAGSRSSSPMPLPRTPLPCQALDWPGLARRPLLLHTVMRSAVAGSGTGRPIHPIRCFLPDRSSYLSPSGLSPGCCPPFPFPCSASKWLWSNRSGVVVPQLAHPSSSSGRRSFPNLPSPVATHHFLPRRTFN
jgi:hypothetical protein